VPAPIRPGWRGDEKQFQSGEVESFSRTLLATSITLLLTYFSLVFLVLAPPSVYFTRSSAHSLLSSDVPFSSTYCTNNSNIATIPILERHGTSGGRKCARREPESEKKLEEDETGRGAKIKLMVKFSCKIYNE